MRRLVLFALAALLLAVLAYVGAAQLLIAPVQRSVGAPPVDLPAEPLQIDLPNRASGSHVAGWFVPGQRGQGAVLLLHGVRADRREMLPRARLMHAQGLAVMLIDLPAHGESPAPHIGLGALEGPAVRAALAELRRRAPDERVGVIGVSLGAAAYVLARPEVPADAVVLEAMYSRIDNAVADRLALRLGSAARFLAEALAEPLLWQLSWPRPWGLGVRREELRPLDALPALRAPLLLASGTADRHTPWADTEALFAAAAQPKQLWRVEDAGHVDLLAFDPPGYAAHVLPFLRQHLKR